MDLVIARIEKEMPETFNVKRVGNTVIISSTPNRCGCRLYDAFQSDVFYSEGKITFENGLECCLNRYTRARETSSLYTSRSESLSRSDSIHNSLHESPLDNLGSICCAICDGHYTDFINSKPCDLHMQVDY